ncbi:MAG: hypothetical protein U0168_10180 [Nannocystaceae bacterium]
MVAQAACLRYQLGGDGSMVLARARSGVAIAALVAAAVAAVAGREHDCAVLRQRREGRGRGEGAYA